MAHKLSLLAARFRPEIPIQTYVPQSLESPSRRLEIVSAWAGLERLLADIIRRFDLKTKDCLEFGVEFGYSAVALSSYFLQVTGVDTFQGDRHTTILRDTYEEALKNIAPYENIHLVRSTYQDYIKQDKKMYDLIHVDILHTFADTYACGLWAARHSQCTIFHDTESYPQVMQAVREIARKTGKTFHNYPECHGLAILV